MASMGKRMKSIREQLEPGKAYGIDEALELLKGSSKVKFTESVDVAIRLGIDPRKSDQNVRGSTVLPNGTGKTVRVAVFTQGENAEKALAAGADVVVAGTPIDLAKRLEAVQLHGARVVRARYRYADAAGYDLWAAIEQRLDLPLAARREPR